MSLIWRGEAESLCVKWEMEISFISEVGKKNVPETSSRTNFEGQWPWGQPYTARSQARRTKNRLYHFVCENKYWKRLSAVPPQRPALQVSMLARELLLPSIHTRGGEGPRGGVFWRYS